MLLVLKTTVMEFYIKKTASYLPDAEIYSAYEVGSDIFVGSAIMRPWNKTVSVMLRTGVCNRKLKKDIYEAVYKLCFS